MAATKSNKKKVQYWGTGRRKKAIARVRLIPAGDGTITINKKSIDEYLCLDTLNIASLYFSCQSSQPQTAPVETFP